MSRSHGLPEIPVDRETVDLPLANRFSVQPGTGMLIVTVSTGFDDYKAAVANIIPAQRAGGIAVRTGLDQGTGYCAIDPLTFESRAHKRIYVLGDATIAGEMPKSGFSANNQAKACEVDQSSHIPRVPRKSGHR
jgi:hypothetical protein